MKKKIVDYSTFNLSKINEPKFCHLKLLGGWIIYFILFFLTEKFIPIEKCHIIYCKMDDMIPFCEYFLIPYVVWYFYIFFSLLHFLLHNTESFKKLQTYIIITQIIALTVYVVYPNCQNLRPEVFQNKNFLTDCIGMLYSVDTNTGVCPSMHCAYSVAIASVWVREKGVSVAIKVSAVLFSLLVCLSTMFIKQHSVIDFFAALAVCLVAEIIIYGKNLYFCK